MQAHTVHTSAAAAAVVPTWRRARAAARPAHLPARRSCSRDHIRWPQTPPSAPGARPPRPRRHCAVAVWLACCTDGGAAAAAAVAAGGLAGAGVVGSAGEWRHHGLGCMQGSAEARLALSTAYSRPGERGITALLPRLRLEQNANWVTAERIAVDDGVPRLARMTPAIVFALELVIHCLRATGRLLVCNTATHAGDAVDHPCSSGVRLQRTGSSCWDRVCVQRPEIPRNPSPALARPPPRPPARPRHCPPACTARLLPRRHMRVCRSLTAAWPTRSRPPRRRRPRTRAVLPRAKRRAAARCCRRWRPPPTAWPFARPFRPSWAATPWPAATCRRAP